MSTELLFRLHHSDGASFRAPDLIHVISDFQWSMNVHLGIVFYWLCHSDCINSIVFNTINTIYIALQCIVILSIVDFLLSRYLHPAFCIGIGQKFHRDISCCGIIFIPHRRSQCIVTVFMCTFCFAIYKYRVAICKSPFFIAMYGFKVAFCNIAIVYGYTLGVTCTLW